MTAKRLENKSKGRESNYDYRDSYHSEYELLASPYQVMLIEDLYDAYKCLLLSKGIIPLQFSEIHSILSRITFMEHSGRKKHLINHAEMDSRKFDIITQNKFERISFVSDLYKTYKLMRTPLWLYTNKKKWKLSNFTRLVIILQTLELTIVAIILINGHTHSINLLIARASAIVILINSCFLLVHTSNMLKYFSNRLIYNLSTNSKGVIHKLFGFKIIAGTISHVVGHILHVDNVIQLCKSGCSADIIRTIRNPKTSIAISWEYFMKQWAYFTGIALILLIVLMIVVLSLKKFNFIRSAVFYNFHRLIAILFLVVIVLHGVEQLLGFNLSYIAIVPPLLFYLFDRRAEILRNNKIKISSWHITNKLIRINIISSNKLLNELRQSIIISVFVNHPEVSKLEWHPFTLTLGINKYESSFNIKATGKWTREFMDRILLNSTYQIEQYIHLGHMTQSCFRFYKFYKIRIFFCAGTGLTPFLTVMRNILNNQEHSNDIFIWSIKDMEIIREFQSTINNISEILNRRLQMFIFYSNFKMQTSDIISSNQLDKFNFLQTLIHYYESIDIVHNIKFPVLTILERINPTTIISRIMVGRDNNSKIGIFVCGGKSYSNSIRNAVDALSENEKKITLDLWIDRL